MSGQVSPSSFNAKLLGSPPKPFRPFSPIAELGAGGIGSNEQLLTGQSVKGLSSKIIRVLGQKQGLNFDNSFSFCKNHPLGLTARPKVFTLCLSSPGCFRVVITELQFLSFDFRAKRSSLLLVAGSPNRPSGFRRPEGLLFWVKITRDQITPAWADAFQIEECARRRDVLVSWCQKTNPSLYSPP